MKKMKNLILTIGLTLSLIISLTLTFGQVSQGGTPYSFDKTINTKNRKPIKSKEDIQKTIMPTIKPSQIDSIKQRNKSGEEIFQFAYPFDININIKTQSTVDTLEIGVLYRYAIISSGAYSLNIIFGKYEIPRGAKLFIYSLNTEHIIGAFTSNNNNSSKVLATIPVKGDSIIIEYFEPLFPEFEGQLIIEKIGHDFLNFYEKESNSFGSSGNCHVDINCIEGNNWQNEKRAVCKIVIDGSGLCSGALINNTNQDGTAYFLTANHCINTQNIAEKSVFIFNYESPSCNGYDGSQSQSIAGANLKATKFASDFTLLELFKKPLSTYTPFYAGWDRNDAQGAGGAGIHHPSGDVKKISTYNIVPPNSINCFNDRPNENFYKITWIATPNGHGVTEGGSSGSPLFNSDRRIIGQLYGPGYCSNFNCSDPANDISNYGKIFASWNGNSANQRLRDWLNPENNVLTWNGINGCGQGVAVNLNITHTITSGSVELHQATNTITASNTIEAGATTTYEAQTIVLKDGFVAEAGSNFVTRSVDFNCVVTCDPINVVSWTNYICRNDILCFLVSNASTYTVKINTLNGVLVHQGSGNASSTTVCVWDAFGVASGTYIATVSFSNDCQEISNTYQVVVGPCLKSFEEEAEKEGEKEETHTLSVYDTSQLDFNFIVFPNPNDGSFSLIINNDIDMPYSLEIINSDGKIIYCIEQLNAIQINISQTGLPKGSYFVRIKSANKISTQKVIIQ